MSTNTPPDVTPDLVDQIFGEVATVQLASLILLNFLHSNLLTVESDGRELLRHEWPEACAVAAYSKDARADPANLSDLSKNYTWKWCQILHENTAHGIEIFLNVVGLSAYVAAMTTSSVEEIRNREVTTRFVTLPRSFGPLQDPTSPDNSYSPPHFFALPSTSFSCKNTRNASCRPEEFLEKPSPMCIIQEEFPSILDRFPHVIPDINCQEGPLQIGFRTASGPAKSHDVPSDPAFTLRDELISLGASLEANIQRSDSPRVERILREQRQRCFLDLSRVCAPEVLLPGVISVEDDFDEHVQTVMRHQRRSQPWLRFLLGLAIDEDEIGLFRADAVGLQEYTFDRTTGFGVIQVIRIALGIIVATNEEIGIHPILSFREVVGRPRSESDHETGRNDTASNEELPPKKKARLAADNEYHRGTISSGRIRYRYKEMNFCTLENKNLRIPDSNAILPQTKYYVKYLLEDEGSLFGRSTRIWCVYREVFDEERGKYPEAAGVVETCPLFIGPFALKMYNANVNHEAYKSDLVQRAIEANVRHVVLPKYVWYLGRVVRDLRPGSYPQADEPEMDDREEIVMISPFKRTLAQFSNAGEFYRGLIDALKGIESLEKMGLMHCDVSISNILLEAETCPESQDVLEFVTFSSNETADSEIALLLQPSGSDGGLHDLDLLDRVPTCQEPDQKTKTADTEIVRFPRLSGPDNIEHDLRLMARYMEWFQTRKQSDQKTKEFNRVGTLPYMSISCIEGKKHLVIDDVESLFYVLYLSMFRFPGPVPNCYPSAPKQAAFRYPKEIEHWTDDMSDLYGWTEEKSYHQIHANKSSFFEWQGTYTPYPNWVLTAATQSLPFWKNTILVHRIFLGAFHENLWRRVDHPGSTSIKWVRNKNFSLRMLIEELEKYESSMRELLTDLK